MSVKTRIESLEKRLVKPEAEESVVRVREITARNREEVERLRALGCLDTPPDKHWPVPRGLVRLVIEEADVDDVLRTAAATLTQGEGG